MSNSPKHTEIPHRNSILATIEDLSTPKDIRTALWNYLKGKSKDREYREMVLECYSILCEKGCYR